MTPAAGSPPPPARRTAPIGVALSALAGLRRSIPALAGVVFVMRDKGPLLWVAIAALAAVAVVNTVVAALQWRRLTFTVGPDDLRVERGVLARTARSVPYDRIHDVNLEQGLLARAFGLVKVAFDTGAGGEDDVTLAYLDVRQGEELRALVRARRDAARPSALQASHNATSDGEAIPAQAPGQATADQPALFAMGARRVLTFGLFEFSLAVIAVLFGITQQFDFLLPFDLWDWQGWEQRLSSEVSWLAGLGSGLQAVGAVLALVALLTAGIATGVVRTVLREWDFRLERSERGFRRRRGLLTRTDVVMPVHRVQAMRMGTRVLRARFGWHGLTFLSLAQDAGTTSHSVAPFGQPEELWPIARAAGFHAPQSTLDWHRPSTRYRRDAMVVAGVLPLAGVVVAIGVGMPLLALVPMAIAAVLIAEKWFAWRLTEHGWDDHQILSRRGWLARRLEIVRRIKLQSVEFRQGPLGRRHGYGTVHLGVAGGTIAIPGVPAAGALALRRAILASTEATDFSQLDRM